MFKNILVPLDLQNRSTAEKALRLLSNYVDNPEARINIMTVLPGLHIPLLSSHLPADAVQNAMAALRSELTELLAEQAPELENCRVHVAEGVAHKEIIKASSQFESDLIIMPSHNHNRVENILIGSVTSRVVEKAKCSVLVVRL